MATQVAMPDIGIMVNMFHPHNGSSTKSNGSSASQNQALLWQLLGKGNDPA
jgi:hypothetical protein